MPIDNSFSPLRSTIFASKAKCADYSEVAGLPLTEHRRGSKNATSILAAGLIVQRAMCFQQANRLCGPATGLGHGKPRIGIVLGCVVAAET